MASSAPKQLELAIRGFELIESGAHEEALQIFTTLTTLDPADAYNQVALGVVLNAMGQREDAVSAFTRAIELKPTETAAFVNRGQAHLEQGRAKAALADYRHVVELTKDLPDRARHQQGLHLVKLAAAALEGVEDTTSSPFVKPVSRQARVSLRFDTVEELLAAVGPHTRLTLKPPAAGRNVGVELPSDYLTFLLLADGFVSEVDPRAWPLPGIGDIAPYWKQTLMELNCFGVAHRPLVESDAPGFVVLQASNTRDCWYFNTKGELFAWRAGEATPARGSFGETLTRLLADQRGYAGSLSVTG